MGQSANNDHLIALVEKGDAVGVRKMIEDRAVDLNTVRGFNEYTLLHYAANKGSNTITSTIYY